MKFFAVVLLGLVTTNLFAANVNCKPSSNAMFYGVQFQTNGKNASGVLSSTGGYGALGLDQCRVSGTKTTCTKTYLRNEDKKPVTHTVRIYVGNPLRTSYVERDLIIPGQTPIKGEILNYCDVR